MTGTMIEYRPLRPWQATRKGSCASSIRTTPKTVARGLAVARDEIADMVAQGKALPMPRVISTRDLARLTDGQYRSVENKAADRGYGRDR